MKVSVYTRDGRNASSSYYRIIQYFDIISKSEKDINVKMRIFCPTFLTKMLYNTSGVLGVIVKISYHFFVLVSSIYFFISDIISPPDVIVLLRSVIPKTCFFPSSFLYSCMLQKCEKVIWDFDDDIFLHEISNREKNIIYKNVDYIVVTHEYLKQLLPVTLQNCVKILPTTDGDFSLYDIKKVIDNRLDIYDDCFSVVWLASSAGLNDIRSICECLDDTGNYLIKNFNKKIKLYVICNKPLLYDFKYIELINVKWTRDVAKRILVNSHVGIMPLLNNKFALGKGGFKLVQYYAIGLPGIGSDIGYNSKIIDNGINGFLISDINEWKTAIINLATDKEKWYRLSFNAYDKWLSKYNFHDNLKTWLNLLRNLEEV